MPPAGTPGGPAGSRCRRQQCLEGIAATRSNRLRATSTTAAILTLAVLLSGTPGRAVQTDDDRQANPIPVVTTPSQHRVFEERLAVQGTVEARTAVLVPPRVSGTLVELSVDEGDRVEAGTTRLFRTDDINLANALEVARLDLAVARCGVTEKEANLEREVAACDRKRKSYERQKRLFEQDRIGTLDQVEEAESQFKQAGAAVRHAESLVALAREQTRQAEAAVKIAEKNLSDATVLAPITGVVSERFQDVGEMGNPAHPVFRIVDLNRLEVSIYLPARHYGAIYPGKTSLNIRTEALDLGPHPVSYRSPTIDKALRVFEVKCNLDSPPHSVVPGTVTNVTVVLKREQGIGVPTRSVVKRRGRDVVFRVRDHKACAVRVQTGLETDGWIQVRSEELAEGAPIVSMGQFLLDDGVTVQLTASPENGREQGEN